MLGYEYQCIKSAITCTCDHCGLNMTVHDSEWSERVSISQVGGVGSIFGDGNRIMIDLCQHCLKEILSPWLRIEDQKAKDEFEKAALKMAVETFGNEAKACEWLGRYHPVMQAKPIDLLATPEGLETVLRTLKAIEFGLPV